MDNDGDDDFEYDDDFDYSVGSETDSDDENIRQEIELDDIKNNLRHNSSKALSQLKTLATCYSSSVCVDAALQLFRLRVSPESFLTLVQTIASAPDSVEEYARCGAFDDGVRLLQRANDISKQCLIEIYVSAVSILRSMKSTRVYLRALLELAELYMLLGDIEAASQVLHNDLEPALLSMSELSLPPFKFEVQILNLRLCMATDPIRRTDIRHLIKNISEIHRGARSVTGTIVFQLVQALLKIEAGMLDDAKILLTESFKSQAETDTVDQDSTDCTSVSYMLVLVSTVLGAGHFDPFIELPLIAGFSADDQRLHLPFKMATAFKNRDPLAFVNHMKELEQSFSDARWRLGQSGILNALKVSFLAMQFTRSLQTYSRIKWETLVKAVGPPLTPQGSDFCTLALDNELPGAFKRNEIDSSIDRLSVSVKDWRSLPRAGSEVTTLPERYLEQASREAQKDREAKILSKWKQNVLHPSLLVPKNTSDEERVPNLSVHQMLIDILNRHFEAMSR